MHFPGNFPGSWLPQPTSRGIIFRDLGCRVRLPVKFPGKSSSREIPRGISRGIRAPHPDFAVSPHSAPPIPTPPIYETVTWGEPPPVPSEITTTADMKQHAMRLINRTPSRRGSMVETTTSYDIANPVVGPTPPIVRHAPALVTPVVNQPTTRSASGPSDPASNTGGVHRNDTSGLDIPKVGMRRPHNHVTAPSAPIVDALNTALHPGSLRRRFSPPRHQVVTE